MFKSSLKIWTFHVYDDFNTTVKMFSSSSFHNTEPLYIYIFLKKQVFQLTQITVQQFLQTLLFA